MMTLRTIDHCKDALDMIAGRITKDAKLAILGELKGMVQDFEFRAKNKQARSAYRKIADNISVRINNIK